MRERRRGRVRWGRAVARWVVVSVVLMAAGVGVVYRASVMVIPSGRLRRAIRLEAPNAVVGQDFETLRIARLSAIRTGGEAVLATWFIGTMGLVETPRLLGLGAWMTDAEVRRQAPRLQGPVRRLRDVLGEMRGPRGGLDSVLGVDVRAGFVPLGMVLERTYGTGPIVVPASVRRSYPVVVPVALGTRVMMLRAWSIAGWSMAIGAVVAVAPVGVVGVRRAMRRRGGRCVWCGYSRVGLAEDAVCPECGEGK